ncbi:DUF1493 family protein [Pseudomonas sp. C3-2018]|uniref:DUF1493 family protein n=1 Tax=Pseudomonas sp. C3-2018 TaxID=2898587 RepID=UPI001E57C2A4|nr:DUF1493 family protein [Pseudomonas sp. C3-2018]MCD4531029.1 DUF1493 family protein [Pseudomonas sp. C3-2018]
MTYCVQSLLFLCLYFLLHYQIKDRLLRKWSGLVFLTGGLILILWLPYMMLFFSTPIISIGTFLIGVGLFVTQNKYRRLRPGSPLHPLWRVSTNLADDFPFDPDMQQLLDVLHEEIGLPRYRAIGLDTAINLDLGCGRREARYVIKALRQDFGTDFSGYKAWRYFPRPMFDRLPGRWGNGGVGEIPLTIGMLYQAIKARRWDTRALERF